MKKFSLISNLNPPRHKLRPLVLPLVPWEQNPDLWRARKNPLFSPLHVTAEPVGVGCNEPSLGFPQLWSEAKEKFVRTGRGLWATELSLMLLIIHHFLSYFPYKPSLPAQYLLGLGEVLVLLLGWVARPHKDVLNLFLVQLCLSLSVPSSSLYPSC